MGNKKHKFIFFFLNLNVSYPKCPQGWSVLVCLLHLFFFARRFNRCGRDGKGRAGIAKLLKPSSFAGPLLVLMGFLADIIGFSIVFHRFLWFTVGS